MLSDITIGQYYPGRSLLHRLDPRVKIVLLLLLMAEIFIFSNWLAYGALIALTGGLMLASGVPVLVLLKSVRPLLWIIVLTFIIHLLGTPGEALATLGPLTITWEGVTRGSFICLRLVLLILLSSLLTFTTSPVKLTDAMEALLSPFRRFGVPAHELAMMMTIALRFVPTLIEETDRIMKAQQARGVDFATGGIMTRVKAAVPIMVPLFLSAFRRADELALAMEARCYRGGVGRTQMKALKVTRLDCIAAALMLAMAAGLALLAWWG
ncbi:MAG: energy-coupling factor transporter transmembrane protein EcfT [Selenomonas ruminantium]|nr:energy-coupling factor transporter transmembrane protein EcfT [Selenomonas ruminantium]